MFENYPDVLHVSEIAEYLGIAKRTILTEISKGDLKCYKIGRHYIIYKNDLIDYMNSKLVKKNSINS